MNENLYPPSIQGAPPELTIPNRAYRRQVIIVLISLCLFILFYFGLIATSGWFAYELFQALNTPPAVRRQQPVSYTVWAPGVLSCVLFVFLVKTFFKWRKQGEDMRIEVTDREQPDLFSFIRRICYETQAPFPHRIFLMPDVEASVFYESPLRSLIMRTPKNLVIGLGLVNGLNLSEFKAVLTHEFGHFSQSSMRLGSYVYMANRIIYDLVYQRDGFDATLAIFRQLRFNYLAIFAYVVTGTVWILRKSLQMAFKAINFFGSALSRQMEFHADLVAVSITGSDSLIHALKKLDFVNACQMQSFRDLKDASEHKLYTQDLFYHQTAAASHLRRVLEKPDFGMIPALPADPTIKVQLFTQEERQDDARTMWASHPSDYDREQNAKQHYLRSIEDDRSPWLLFHNPDQLRQRMTEQFYQHVLELKNIRYAPPEQVQAFIDGEHNETMQDARYLGMYDGRLLSLPAERLTEYANEPSLTQITDAQIGTLLARLYNAEYKDWLKAHHKRHEENGLLEALEQGSAKLKGNTFTFRNQQYKKTDFKSLAQMVEAELATDEKWLEAFDQEVFWVHLRIAQILGEGDRELYERYYFHLHLQDTVKTARLQEIRLIGLLQYFSSKGDKISRTDFTAAMNTLEEIRVAFNRSVKHTRSLAIPPLQNMQSGIPLSDYLLEEPLLVSLGTVNLDAHWVNALLRQIRQVEERCRRLYFKSMGAILLQQEALAERYQNRQKTQTEQEAE